MALWDQWRKRKKVPPRQQKIADKVKKSYIKKIQQVVKKYQEKIRKGEVIEKKEISDYIRDNSKAESARAKTIVETETTRYWNTIRKNVYDESEDVTHYLFMAIRDMATTKWCKTRTGLVYAKGDPLLEKEKPPCHWNCRSEILPLTPQNPKHKKIIDDKSRWRRNHSPEPLPHGWNK
jgi:SPP1 gp7 family putative phage head morphogenesis protein